MKPSRIPRRPSSASHRLTKNGIPDADRVEHELDMVIAATGYDQSHMPRFLKLVSGKSFKDLWSDAMSPRSYMALCLKGMPNSFKSSSDYGPLPQGNYYQSSEAFIEYIVKAVNKTLGSCLYSRDRAVEHFVRHANSSLKLTVVTGPCASWKGQRKHRASCFVTGCEVTVLADIRDSAIREV
ncbi:hypothetical protein LTR17_002752 [Elasticomyces elasticus]|nr:hypothetical protein LTR17_002752 [Elasticomyces elasticus]